MRTCLGCLLLVGTSVLTVFQATASVPTPMAGGTRPTIQDKTRRVDLYGDPLPDGAIARLGSMHLRDPGGYQWAGAVSADATLLASAVVDRIIVLWDLPSGKPRLRLDVGPNNTVMGLSPDMALSPDGKLLVTADEAIYYWDTTTGKQFFKIANDKQYITNVTFSPDGTLLASCGKRPGVCLWDVATGCLVRTLGGDDKDHLVGRIAFAPDGKVIASVADCNVAARIWDVATGKEIRRHTNAQGFWAVAFTPDSRALAVGGRDGHVSLYDRDTGKQRWRMEAVTDNLGINALAFSPDGAVLACKGNSSVRLWNAVTCQECPESAAVPEGLFLHGWLAKGRVLVLSGRGVLRLWDSAAGKDVHVTAGHLDAAAAAAWAPDGKTIASASADGTIRLWEANTGRELRSWTAHDKRPVTGIVFLPDGKSIVSVGLDGQIRRWETKTGKMLACFVTADRSVRRLTLAADGRTLIAGGYYLAESWDLFSGQALSQFGSLPTEGEKMPAAKMILGLAASPDGKLLVTPELDGPIRFWDMATGKERLPPKLLGKAVVWMPVVISPNSRVFAVNHTHNSGGISVWETATFRQRCELRVDHRIEFLTFAPDGRFLACAEESGKVLLLDIATGDTVGRLHAPGPIQCQAFAPDGRRLVTGNYDGTLLVWKVPEVPRQQVNTSLRSAWAGLASADAQQAHRAIWALVESAGTVPFLRQRLRPASVPAEVAGWVADLDNPSFAKRKVAMAALEQLGNLVEDALQSVLAGKPSLEARRRAEILLSKLPLSADGFRELRAVEVLEYIGTAEAQQLLEALTHGAPAARLTQEARAALHRLLARRI
jgi:WD40 repeat protein